MKTLKTAVICIGMLILGSTRTTESQEISPKLYLGFTLQGGVHVLTGAETSFSLPARTGWTYVEHPAPSSNLSEAISSFGLVLHRVYSSGGRIELDADGKIVKRVTEYVPTSTVKPL